MSTLFLYSLLAIAGVLFLTRGMRRELRLLLVLCAVLALNGPLLLRMFAGHP